MLKAPFIIFTISAISLLYYAIKNDNRRIERYYYKNHLLLFALLAFVQFLLLAGLVLNARYMINLLGKLFFTHIKNKFFN